MDALRHRGGEHRLGVPGGVRGVLGYGAGAIAPLLFGAILDWQGLRTVGAWGWAFVSLGVPGVGAVLSVGLLHRTPEAAALPPGGGARERSGLRAHPMSAGVVRTRLASAADAAAIAAIYDEGLEERIATFETDPPTPAQVAALLADRGERFPTVVVARGHVVTWAGAGPYRSRPAYAGVAAHSVYVARAARGTGAGRAALSRAAGAEAERLVVFRRVRDEIEARLAAWLQGAGGVTAREGFA